MSRFFVKGSSQFLEVSNVAVSAYPFTLEAWYWPTSQTATATVFGLESTTTTSRYMVLGTLSGGQGFFEFENGTLNDALGPSTPVATNGKWNHLAAVVASATSRTCYVNGVPGTVQSSSLTFPTNLNVTGIGSLKDGGAARGSFADGHIAYCILRNVALSATDVASLATGMNPLAIQPNSVVGWWILTGTDSPELDSSGGAHTAAVTGATNGNNTPPFTVQANPVLRTPQTAPWFFQFRPQSYTVAAGGNVIVDMTGVFANAVASGIATFQELVRVNPPFANAAASGIVPTLRARTNPPAAIANATGINPTKFTVSLNGIAPAIANATGIVGTPTGGRDIAHAVPATATGAGIVPTKLVVTVFPPAAIATATALVPVLPNTQVAVPAVANAASIVQSKLIATVKPPPAVSAGTAIVPGRNIVRVNAVPAIAAASGIRPFDPTTPIGTDNVIKKRRHKSPSGGNIP